MAWYRCGGGGSGKDRPIYKTVKLYQGKIAHSDGQVVADTDYYYTNYFPMTTDLTFDMGYTTTSDNYVGVYMYKDDKSYVSNWYWNPTQRYRNLSSGQLSPMYESGARWIRVSFPANKLKYIMLHDWVNGIMYSTEEVVRITDKESHDIDLIPNPATSESTEPFANSEYAAELAVWKAFDKSKSTFWASANSNGDKYIGWKFSSAVAVNKVYMAIGSNSGWEIHQAPNTWFVEGSNDDGTTWTVVNYNEHSWTNAYEEIEYEFLNETAYKWWRIRITRTMDGTSGCASLAELDFYNVCDSYQLGTKTITENGTYSAKDDGVDGYSEVTVDTREYVDLTLFDLYLNRNTTTPTITHISSTEVSLSFQDQSASGYELCSFRLPLETGIYVAEIKATVDKNTGLNNSYGWGIYSSRSDDGASLNNNTPYEYRVIGNYVAFDKSDTAEHYYEVPINIVWNAAENNGYVCFTTAADNGVNATITVSSLKIRKV